MLIKNPSPHHAAATTNFHTGRYLQTRAEITPSTLTGEFVCEEKQSHSMTLPLLFFLFVFFTFYFLNGANCLHTCLTARIQFPRFSLSCQREHTQTPLTDTQRSSHLLLHSNASAEAWQTHNARMASSKTQAGARTFSARLVRYA